MKTDLRQVELEDLPVPAAVRKVLQRTKGICGAVFAPGLTDSSVVVWGPGTSHTTEEAARATAWPGGTLIWRRGEHPPTDNRVAQAVKLVQAKRKPLSVAEAAAQVGVSAAAVYKGLAIRREKGVCSHCGQVLP